MVFLKDLLAKTVIGSLTNTLYIQKLQTDCFWDLFNFQDVVESVAKLFWEQVLILINEGDDSLDILLVKLNRSSAV